MKAPTRHNLESKCGCGKPGENRLFEGLQRYCGKETQRNHSAEPQRHGRNPDGYCREIKGKKDFELMRENNKKNADPNQGRSNSDKSWTFIRRPLPRPLESVVKGTCDRPSDSEQGTRGYFSQPLPSTWQKERKYLKKKKKQIAFYCYTLLGLSGHSEGVLSKRGPWKKSDPEGTLLGGVSKKRRGIFVTET